LDDFGYARRQCGLMLRWLSSEKRRPSYAWWKAWLLLLTCQASTWPWAAQDSLSIGSQARRPGFAAR